MNGVRKRNTAIDAFRLIFSICIIGIHMDLFKDVNTIAFHTLTQSLFRIGVPFYFLVSGYFFAGKLDHPSAQKAWFMRLMKIYLIFEIIDIILNLSVVRAAYPLTYVILRFFTTGLNRIYWYLISLILTCFICRKFWKNGYTVHLICAGFLLYLITMTYDSYSFLFQNTFFAKIGEAHAFVWAWPQAGFGESVLFLSAGVYLKQKQPEIRHLNLLLCISLCLLIAEGNFCQSHCAADANCYFTLIPSSVLLFLWTLRHPDLLYMKDAGELSLYVYMIHTYFSWVTHLISPLSVIRFPVSAVLTLLVSALIVSVQKRKTAKKKTI